MIVEVKGVAAANHGAHLMLLAVVEGMREHWRAEYGLNARSWLSFSRHHRAEYRAITRLQTGSSLKVALRVDRLLRAFPPLAPRRVRIATPKAVRCVLDASGFSYSDQLSLGNMRSTAEYYEWLSGRGVPIVLMPQAYGPFRTPETKALMRRIVDTAIVTYCRDRESLQHLEDACGPTESIRMAPDFTFGLAVDPESRWGAARRAHVSVVPNARMLDKTDDDVGGAYLRFLRLAIEELRQQDLPVRIVVQGDPGDVAIAQQLLERSDGRVSVVQSNDPLETKRIIGASRAVITSRFHGAINALSYGRPVLVTSWSHKYAQLLKDFGMERYVIDLSRDEARWRDDIAALVDAADDDAVRARLLDARDGYVASTNRMWQEIAELVAPGTRSVSRARIGALA